MWSCCRSNNQNSYSHLEETTNQYLEECSLFFRQLKQKIQEAGSDIYAYCTPNEQTYLGRLKKVTQAEPANSPNRLENQAGCHHILYFEDGYNFLLSFDHVSIDELEDHLQPGYLLKVIYRPYDNKVINIYPQPYYRKTTLGEALESNSVKLNDHQKMKIHYLEGRQTKVEIFLNDQEEDEYQLINPEHVAIEIEEGDLDLDCMNQEY
jgi:hypothetical protein